MKKVWYLSAEKEDKKRVAKLFIYEKSDKTVAQLDLSAFSDFTEKKIRKLKFVLPDCTVIEEIDCETESDFFKKALTGKGSIVPDVAGKLKKHQKELELVIQIEDVFYVSGEAVKCQMHPTKGGSSKQTFPDDPMAVSDAKDQEIKRDDGQSGWENADTLNRTDNETEPVAQNDAGSRTNNETEPVMQNGAGIHPDNRTDEEISYDLNHKMSEEAYDEADDDLQDLEIKSGFRKVIELGVLEDEMLFRAYVHNSFLLHGYYNYGHLVLDERNGISRLGVPGNYYEREQMVAAMFGFPDFEPARDEEIQNGTFGYFFTKG